jgi:hypothetical protein
MTTTKGTHMNTRKISQQTRYIIEKRELELDYDCQHPMCDTLHKKWISNGICMKPTAPHFDWIIWNEIKNEVIEVFEYQRDAKQHLLSVINSLTDIEWQQIIKAGA